MDGVSSAQKIADAVEAERADGFKSALRRHIVTSADKEILQNAHVYEDIAAGFFKGLGDVFTERS